MSGARSRTWESVAILFARALREGGTRKGVSLVQWDIAGRCEAPYTTVISGTPSEGINKRKGRFVELIPGLTKCTLSVEITAPCRRCPPCLRKRAAVWRFKARSETMFAPRTWFGTLTFSPEWRYRLLAQASRAAARKGEDFDALNRQARFRYYSNASGALVTKWLKRIRKDSGVKLRYLLVAEEHKSRDPHWHVLIHEVDREQPVRKAVLKTQWSHGFSKWNLVHDLQTADYVCKYISKSLYARVRASMRYGKDTPSGIDAQHRVDPDPPNPLYLATLDGRGLNNGGGISGGLPGAGERR